MKKPSSQSNLESNPRPASNGSCLRQPLDQLGRPFNNIGFYKYHQIKIRGSNMQVLTEVLRCQIHCCSIVNRFLMRDTNTLAQLQLHLDQIIHLLKIHSDVAIFWKCFEYLCNDSTTITELILTARMMYFIPHTWQRFEFPQIVFLRLCVTSITCIPTFCTLRFIKLT